MLAAIEGKKTDRTPADYQGLPVVTEGLIAKLGVADEEEMREALGIDRRLYPCEQPGVH